MARIDPDKYPDRLAFHAHARHLRAQEIARLLRHALTRLQLVRHVVARALATPVARNRSHG